MLCVQVVCLSEREREKVQHYIGAMVVLGVSALCVCMCVYYVVAVLEKNWPVLNVYCKIQKNHCLFYLARPSFSMYFYFPFLFLYVLIFFIT